MEVKITAVPVEDEGGEQLVDVGVLKGNEVYDAPSGGLYESRRLSLEELKAKIAALEDED